MLDRLPTHATMTHGGSPRIEAWESGQVRKEAAITTYRKCRGSGSPPDSCWLGYRRWWPGRPQV